jgi:hypothetical protein
MKYIALLIFSVFLITIIQTANAKSIVNHNDLTKGNLTSAINGYRHNTPAAQEGLIQNNPGYTPYIPHTSTYPDNSAKIIRDQSNFSTYTTKYINNTPAAHEGLIQNNPGYAQYIPHKFK